MPPSSYFKIGNSYMSAKIIAISNEKGGSGKTTVAIHLIITLLQLGHKVASIDLDYRQKSLTRYIENRETTAKVKGLNLEIPVHEVIYPSTANDLSEAKKEELDTINNVMAKLRDKFDFIVIDTPGNATNLSTEICSLADTIITPVGDSFIDLDLLGQANAENLSKISPGIYSAMLWDQKMKRAANVGKEIEWFVVRNRLAILDSINNRNIEQALNALSKKLGFKIIPGFSDRVIFKELFLHGLTLHDAMHTDIVRVTTSTVAARQELRRFVEAIGITQKAAA